MKVLVGKWRVAPVALELILIALRFVSFQFTLAVVILAFVGYSSANAIGQVVDVAKSASPVGSHGPALVNVLGWGGWNNGWNNGGWNNGGWNNGGWGNDGWGNAGQGWNGGVGHGVVVGAPHGAPLIALKTDGWGVSGWGVGAGNGHDG